MLDHAQIWQAIDRLARERGLSVSGLARLAGLDPTTFNKSKRLSREGKRRWPSTESLARILAATGASLAEFAVYAEPGGVSRRRVPRTRLGDAERPGRFDDRGRPSGPTWTELLFPELDDPRAFALEVDGEAAPPPLRPGDVVIVSPRAGIRRGDRVVVRSRAGRIVVGALRKRGDRVIQLGPLEGTAGGVNIPLGDVDWIARIVWASQ